MANSKGTSVLRSYKPFKKVTAGENISAVSSKSGSSKAKECLPYVNDLASSTVQQIFVRSSIPVYKPLDPVAPGSDTEPKYHSCEDCGDKFLFASSLAFHVNRYSVSIKFNCEYCSRRLQFYNRCNFLAHLRLHNSELSEEELAALDITSQPIPHNKIPNNFNVSTYLNPEINSIIVDPGKPYCVECKETVVDLTLKQHYVGTNKPIPSLACKECNLILPTECSLSAHIRNHSQVAPFVCPDCAIEFNSFNLLSNHMSSECFHTFKLVRYKCQRCVCMFTKPENLFSHIVSQHLKCSMPFCRECPHYFQILRDRDNSALKSISHSIHCQLCWGVVITDIETHVMSHVHNPSYQKYAYKCTKCNYSCENVVFYRRHITQEHPKLSSITQVVYDVETQHLNKKTTSPPSMPVINCVPKNSLMRPFIKNRVRVRQDPPAVLNVDTMPLTPSPEPLVEEEDPLLLDSPIVVVKPVEVVVANNRASNINTNGYSSHIVLHATSSTDKNPPTKTDGIIKKAYANLQSTSSTIRNLPTKTNKMVKSILQDVQSTVSTDKNPLSKTKTVNVLSSGDLTKKYLHKRHPCTRCKDYIYFDGTLNPVELHFAAKHPNYEVAVTKERVPTNSTVNGRSIILVTQKFKITKRNTSPSDSRTSTQVSVNVNGMKKPSNNGLIKTDLKTITNNYKTVHKNINYTSLQIGQQTSTNKNNPTYKVRSLTNFPRALISNKHFPSKAQRLNKINKKQTRDTLYKAKHIIKKHSGSDSSLKLKLKRLRKKKMLDPDFVSNDSDSDHILSERSEDPSYSVKTPPRSKVEQSRKRSANEAWHNEVLDDTPTRTKKQKKKSTGGVAVKTGSPEAPGFGLVISPSKHDANSSFECALPTCDFISKDKDTFREHIITHRVDKNSFQCMECGICFVVKPTFTKHLFIYHQICDAELYILNNNCCDEGLICREIDFNDYQKIREQNIPTVLMEFQCHICYKPCDDSLSLNSHFRTHGMAFLRSQYMKKNS